MEVYEIVAAMRQRKEEQAVRNDLELRVAKQADEAFEDLRTELCQQFTAQIESLNQYGQAGLRWIPNADGKNVEVNQDDSGKTLTITFSPSFRCVSFNYAGGKVFKRSLTVKMETISGLLRTREHFCYVKEDKTRLPQDGVASYVGDLLALLMV